MQRFLARGIILFYLFSAAAWAADLSTLFDGAAGGEAVLLDDGGQPPSPGVSHACDHGCHGSAHYLGMPLDRPAHGVVADARPAGALIAYPPTFSRAPPVHPPRI